MAAAAPRHTKILATIGPASGSPKRLAELVAAGMDGARLNFSHGSHEQHLARAEAARAAAAEAGRPLALVADLQGPKLRLGDLPEPRTLTRGQEVVIAPEGSSGDGDLPVSPAVIGEVLAPGNDVLIDDGLVHLKVEEVE